MADIYTLRKRRELMSRVRSAGNRTTELRLIALLRAASITGWRRKQPLPGRPDFVFRREGVVVFVDGCFWHCCPTHFKLPATNVAFWKKKLGDNQLRDRRQTRLLKASGWKVIRIWSHELKTKIGTNKAVQKIGCALQGRA